MVPEDIKQTSLEAGCYETLRHEYFYLFQTPIKGWSKPEPYTRVLTVLKTTEALLVSLCTLIIKRKNKPQVRQANANTSNIATH